MQQLLEKVKSSNIDSIGYLKEIIPTRDGPVGILFVKFLGGGLYAYYPIKNLEFKRFKKAESKGEFFHQHIKDNLEYAAVKIE